MITSTLFALKVVYSSIFLAILLSSAGSLAATTKKSAITQPKVKAGDTIYSILKRHGFNDNQRRDALSQNPIPEDFVLSPGDVYRLIKNVNGTIEVLFFSKSASTAYIFSLDRIGFASGKTAHIQFDVQTINAKGRVKGSLVESIAQVVGDELLAYRFMDAFLLDYNLIKDLQKNARFQITYEKLYHQGLFVRFGEVRRAEIEINGQNVVRMYRELKSGGGIFYDPNVNLSSRRLFSPVNDIRISSLFQRRRFHPIRKFRRAHEGVDFALPTGSPVYAAAEGVVLRTGRNRAAGRFVVLVHNDGLETYYNHLHSVKPIYPGQTIQAGMMIGQVGCTGYCTKPHLHFAVKRDGSFINPIYLMRNYSFHQRQEVLNLVAQNKK